jgi:hypothetical protein
MKKKELQSHQKQLYTSFNLKQTMQKIFIK